MLDAGNISTQRRSDSQQAMLYHDWILFCKCIECCSRRVALIRVHKSPLPLDQQSRRANDVGVVHTSFWEEAVSLLLLLEILDPHLSKTLWDFAGFHNLYSARPARLRRSTTLICKTHYNP